MKGLFFVNLKLCQCIFLCVCVSEIVCVFLSVVYDVEIPSDTKDIYEMHMHVCTMSVLSWVSAGEKYKYW